MLWTARSVAIALPRLQRGRANHGLFAVGVLAPDVELDFVSVDRLDDALAPERAPGLRHPAVADVEHLQLRVAREIGDQLGKEACLQQAVQDDARKADRTRVFLVVVDLVEVAGRTGVLDERAR